MQIFLCFKECYDRHINLIPLQRSLLIVKNLFRYFAYLIKKITICWEFNKVFSAWELLRVLQTDRRFRTHRLYGVCLWNVNWIESRDACQPDKILFNFVAWNLEDTCSELFISSYFVLHSLETLSVIVDEWKTNLMSLAILFHSLCAQHVSDINISIFRSLRLCWRITTSVVLFSVRCVLEIWCGWFWVVFVLQAKAQRNVDLVDTAATDFPLKMCL